MASIIDTLNIGFDLATLYYYELIEIIIRSLLITTTAVFFASVLGLPLGAWIAIGKIPCRNYIIAFINAMMGLPPVVIGIIVYLLLSNSGPLGVFELLYTPTAMIIAQIVIIVPIIISISQQALSDLWKNYHNLLISVGASHIQCIRTLLWDARRSLITAILAGFGRGIGEVGAVMIVGGNIDHLTRVMTTAITLEIRKGEFAIAVTLGIILIIISISISFIIHIMSGSDKDNK